MYLLKDLDTVMMMLLCDLFIVSSDCHGSGHERDADLGNWPLFSSTAASEPGVSCGGCLLTALSLSWLLFVFLTVVTTDHDQ